MLQLAGHAGVMAADPAAWTRPAGPYSLIFDGAGREVGLVTGFTADECRLFTVDADLSGSDPVDAARRRRLDPAAPHPDPSP